MSIVFIFLDGVGLAPASPDNPLSSAPMPLLRRLLGGPLTLEQVGTMRVAPHNLAVLHAIDATLGIPGLPQSGTGQTALLTGVNAAARHGRHQPHFPPVALRPLLAEQSLFQQVQRTGGRVTFANAFGPGYWQALAARRIRRSASVIAAEGAGLRFRDVDDLRAGRALAWDITGANMRGYPEGWPITDAHSAGRNLAGLATEYDLVFFESFLPDLAGHGRLNDHRPTTDDQPPTTNDNTETRDKRQETGDEQPMPRVSGLGSPVSTILFTIDTLLGGVLAALRPQDTLLITSDHGNIESLAAPNHTRNPVPLLVIGPAAPAFVDVADLTGVTPAIVRVLNQGA